MIDYRKLRPNNITSPEFRHLLLLIYWPIYGIAFYITENVLSFDYVAIESPLDSYIPFCELFVIPYMFWFIYLVGIHFYTGFVDIPQFKKLMYFIMITYTVTIIIYLLFPNMQLLRPIEFKRDNLLTAFMKRFYAFDTHTNVCPSLHVIGSFAVLFTTWNCKGFNTTVWRIINIIITVLISISTVFLKQHSIIDIFAALILCAIAYPIAYILPDKLAAKKAIKAETPNETTVNIENEPAEKI